jgi:hypothetical protein
MGVRRVELEIEELVLEGLGHVDGLAVAAAVERALRTRLMLADGLGETRSVDAVATPAIQLPARPPPETIGRAVANRIQESVRG